MFGIELESLLAKFHGTEGYHREFASELLSFARTKDLGSWRERSIAVLLLENLVLRLGPDELAGLDGVPCEGLERLRRLERAHGRIRRSPEDRVAWEYFFRVAGDISKLTLARYVFAPDEVVAEVNRSLRLTRGCGARGESEPNLPACATYEQEILARLCAGYPIYWVSEHCGSELNALVEYPLTSAVVVIKPPGSDDEIEIKRAGLRGPRALTVIEHKNGREAPLSHRLFGGSLGWLARREVAAGAIFSKIFETVHGKESPCSRGVQNATVVTVPAPAGEAHILDYLTFEDAFGEDYETARAAMESCAAAFPSDSGVGRASYKGPGGLTLQFIGQALPEQAILYGSSSFRLDRLLLYLSDDGPEHYLKPNRLCDVLWLAESVLDEILGEVIVPEIEYATYGQYVRELFAVPENRRRADENYVSVMEQIGECWGTLLAVRGFSDGESFVLRNVGLKSAWRNGSWRTRVIFMDHDDLTVAGSRYPYLWPWREVSGMQRDLVHILGGPMGDDVIPGEVGALRQIYRVNAEVASAGVAHLERAAREAYRRTQSRIASDAEFRQLFAPAFLNGYREFNELVPSFLDTDFLPPGDDELIRTLRHFREFFERTRFLYEPDE